MYLPPHVREDRTDVLHGLIRDRPSGMLVSHGRSGVVDGLAAHGGEDAEVAALVQDAGRTGTP